MPVDVEKIAGVRMLVIMSWLDDDKPQHVGFCGNSIVCDGQLFVERDEKPPFPIPETAHQRITPCNEVARYNYGAMFQVQLIVGKLPPGESF